jgi:uncharacterized low-complexity protein
MGGAFRLFVRRFFMSSKKTALTVALGTAFAASLACLPAANAAANPFAMQSLEQGYMVAAAGEKADAAPKAEGEAKMKDGKCSGDKKMKDGKCSSKKKKMKDGKCGEGKCSSGKMKGDKTKSDDAAKPEAKPM